MYSQHFILQPETTVEIRRSHSGFANDPLNFSLRKPSIVSTLAKIAFWIISNWSRVKASTRNFSGTIPTFFSSKISLHGDLFELHTRALFSYRLSCPFLRFCRILYLMLPTYSGEILWHSYLTREAACYPKLIYSDFRLTDFLLPRSIQF